MNETPKRYVLVIFEYDGQLKEQRREIFMATEHTRWAIANQFLIGFIPNARLFEVITENGQAKLTDGEWWRKGETYRVVKTPQESRAKLAKKGGLNALLDAIQGKVNNSSQHTKNVTVRSPREIRREKLGQLLNIVRQECKKKNNE